MTVLAVSACGKRVRVAAPPAPELRPATPRTVSAELAGLASYYAEPYHGRKTANGETFDTYQELTAAHRTLPFNTVVKVTNQDNGRDVEVRINDRGPFIEGRVIDLSLRAAREIDMVRAGIAPVRLQILKEGAALYAVQVGAFETLDAAEALQRRLLPRYRDVSIQSVDSPRTFFRVRVGRTAQLAAAEQLLRQLRAESFQPFVVRLN
jgi:rare lipoprotein A